MNKKQSKSLALMSLIFVTMSCSNIEQKESSQGMAAFDVKESDYAIAYDRKFSKPKDRLGWSQEQLVAWSRGGAAAACGLNFDKAQYLQKLDAKFPGIGATMHDLNGVTYHQMQISNDPNFCTEARKAEAQNFVSSF